MSRTFFCPISFPQNPSLVGEEEERPVSYDIFFQEYSKIFNQVSYNISYISFFKDNVHTNSKVSPRIINNLFFLKIIKSAMFHQDDNRFSKESKTSYEQKKSYNNSKLRTDSHISQKLRKF